MSKPAMEGPSLVCVGTRAAAVPPALPERVRLATDVGVRAPRPDLLVVRAVGAVTAARVTGRLDDRVLGITLTIDQFRGVGVPVSCESSNSEPN